MSIPIDTKNETKVIQTIESLSGHWGYVLLTLTLVYIAAAIFDVIRADLWFDIHGLVYDNSIVYVALFYYGVAWLVGLMVFKLTDESFYEYYRLKENEARLARGEIRQFQKTSVCFVYNTAILIIGVAFYVGLWAFTRYVTFVGQAFEVWNLWVLEIGFAATVVLVSILSGYLAAKKFDLRVSSTPTLKYGTNR